MISEVKNLRDHFTQGKLFILDEYLHALTNTDLRCDSFRRINEIFSIGQDCESNPHEAKSHKNLTTRSTPTFQVELSVK